MCWQRRGLNALPAIAGILLADMTDNLDRRWNDIQLLADHFTDHLQRPTIVFTHPLGLRQLVQHLYTRQVRRQRLTPTPFAGVRRYLNRKDFVGFVGRTGVRLRLIK